MDTDLELLGREVPGIDSALIEVASLRAECVLPKPTVHVISDVHGDYAKLRHVINNASGTLRPRIEATFAGCDPEQVRRLVSLAFYPREVLDQVERERTDHADRLAFARDALGDLLQVVRQLSRPDRLVRVLRAVPEPYRNLVRDLIEGPIGASTTDPVYLDAMLAALAEEGRALHLVHLIVRTLRNLAVDELVLAGDLWDRGPRGDMVVEYLMRQPNVTITWGNHDMAWLGAALGHGALVAHVLRISCRYRRLSQLEEGYGITLQPLERLVRDVYQDDPANCYLPKEETGLREPLTVARMQKAAAILQYKLEGQMIARHPEWALDHRRLLHRIDHAAGTVTIDGRAHPLLDRHFPTIDPADPYALSAEERACLDRTRQSFVGSQTIWRHMQYLVSRGGMHEVRDTNLIFHGCLSVDEDGTFLPMHIDGQPYTGRALFEALDRAVARTLERPDEAVLDLLWYLWCGPRSPLFGKDRITTFENDLVADPSCHVETKDPYFRLIHDRAFCRRVLAEFGVDEELGLIVNGHVPVKIDKGEDPLKRSGQAITIDGAFSEAYGDHGYTLVLAPEATTLAEHSHFESVEAAIHDGVDIIPKMRTIRRWEPPRRVADTERGRAIAERIERLERLVAAYHDHAVRPAADPVVWP
jgi:fructose-1,6-bisphosphatase-3